MWSGVSPSAHVATRAGHAELIPFGRWCLLRSRSWRGEENALRMQFNGVLTSIARGSQLPSLAQTTADSAASITEIRKGGFHSDQAGSHSWHLVLANSSYQVTA